MDASLPRAPTGPRAEAAVVAFADAGGDATSPGVRTLVALLGEHAPALLPLALGDVTLPADVLRRPLERPDDEESFRRAFLKDTAALGDDDELRRVLRRLRHRAVVRIALREVLRLADVDQTSAEMAGLAAGATSAALEACLRSAIARFGEVRDASGAPVPLVALGMGKLGGLELNLGSDIDLCFFYGTDDATVGSGDVTVHELYARVVSRTVQALAEPTADGFCFRVDLRLRPEGQRGPLVNSLASAERYYESWGRTWERAALLRARAIAGDRGFGAQLLEALRPFVFRRAVDPGIAREMIALLERTRRELRVDGERDVKLGRGGIREAEFFVQTLQLVWGGRHEELRVPGTIEALHRLRSAGLVSDREARELEEDWALLRRMEHRIHMQAGYQTHSLPPPGDAREAFATSLGYRGAAELERALGDARTRIAKKLASLAPDGEEEETLAPALDALCDLVASGATASEIAERVPEALPGLDPDEAAAHLVRLGRHAWSPLGPASRERMRELGPELLREVAEAGDPDAALRFLADFFTRIGGAWSYERLFAEEPRLARRLVGLFGASATLSAAFIGHPEAVDRLLVVRGAPSAEAIREIHARAPVSVEPGVELPDPETFVAALRSAKREVTLEIGLAYVAEDIGGRDVERLLTALADAQIDAALRCATAETFATLGRPSASTGAVPAGMVVVGMGKLGAAELGFGSDLDLLFLYGEDGDAVAVREGRQLTNAEVWTRVAQRTLRLLSQPDAEGTGYSTDARLRPSGSQGMLVVSLAAFERYHEMRAAAWERQALIRARPVAVAGDPALAERAAARLESLAYEGGAPPGEDIASMRHRMEDELAGEKRGRYHPKLGYGGLVDVEFVVQWLQMRHGTDRSVRRRHTIEALEALRAAEHVTAADAEALEQGYTFFRSVEQTLRLLDESREPVLVTGGPLAERVARRLGIRERDGRAPRDVLVDTWRRRATEVRDIFERLVSPVGSAAPWGEA